MATNPYSGKPWLKNYDAHVPANLNYPWMCFIDMARKSIREVPDRAAMIYIDTVITFKELDSLSNKFASFMRERVAPYKVPKQIIFMDSLPLSAVIKILKR